MIINEELLLKIYNKYISIQDWLQKEGFMKTDNWCNVEYLRKELKEGSMRMNQFDFKVIRDNAYIEMGAPSAEDLEVFNITTDMLFKLEMNEIGIRRFYARIESFSKR